MSEKSSGTLRVELITRCRMMFQGLCNRGTMTVLLAKVLPGLESDLSDIESVAGSDFSGEVEQESARLCMKHSTPILLPSEQLSMVWMPWSCR